MNEHLAAKPSWAGRKDEQERTREKRSYTPHVSAVDRRDVSHEEEHVVTGMDAKHEAVKQPFQQ